ncbi:MAG: hypothetical protein F6K35_31740 [Okeania sp. SIO2H7]|nr:hypothetical protein [Okeania sp. SIO2H7]
MESAKEKRQRYQLSCPGLPLAVYREVAAHLRQVSGLKVGLLAPEGSLEFDYDRSQVRGLWMEYAEEAEESDRQRAEEILAYYGDRFGPWQEEEFH